MGKIAVLDYVGTADRPIFESVATGWIEAIAGTMVVPKTGRYSFRWAFDVQVTRTYLFGLLTRRVWDFEFRIEVGGGYVYSYRPGDGSWLERAGYADVLLNEGSVDVFVLINAASDSKVRIPCALLELLGDVETDE